MKQKKILNLLLILMAICITLQYGYNRRLKKEITGLKLSMLRKDSKNDQLRQKNSIIKRLASIPYHHTKGDSNEIPKPENETSEESLQVTDADRRGFASFRKMVKEQFTEHFGEHYRSVFAELNVSETDQRRLLGFLGDIEALNAETTQFIIRLQEAQNKYDEKVRNILPEKDYEEYLKSETLKYANSEYDAITDYFDKKGKGMNSLASSDKEILMDLLMEYDAFAATVQHGPYAELFEPAAGTPRVIEALKKKLSKIENASQLVLGNATERGMSQTAWNDLLDFYSGIYQDTENEVKLLQHRLQFPERHKAVINASPEQQEKLIQELEGEIGIIR